jgi:hypothetical protein
VITDNTNPPHDPPPANHAPPGISPDDDLRAIDRDFPFWHAWEGVIAGLLYARRPNSSPPMVVRATSTDGLRTAIENAEVERGLR